LEAGYPWLNYKMYQFDGMQQTHKWSNGIEEIKLVNIIHFTIIS